MNYKSPNKIWFLIWAVILLFALFAINRLPGLLQPSGPKQVRPHPVKYPYYQIIDHATGRTLTYVSAMSVVKGDEYVTGDNRRYVVVMVKGNKAYAKYAGKIKD
jgi:hypothetical protein